MKIWKNCLSSDWNYLIFWKVVIFVAFGSWFCLCPFCFWVRQFKERFQKMFVSQGQSGHFVRLCPHGLREAWESHETIGLGCPFSHEILMLLSSFSQAMWTKPNCRYLINYDRVAKKNWFVHTRKMQLPSSIRHDGKGS